MSQFVKCGNKWLNLDLVQWIDTEGASTKLYFDKSTIQVVSHNDAEKIIEAINNGKDNE